MTRCEHPAGGLLASFSPFFFLLLLSYAVSVSTLSSVQPTRFIPVRERARVRPPVGTSHRTALRRPPRLRGRGTTALCRRAHAASVARPRVGAADRSARYGRCLSCPWPLLRPVHGAIVLVPALPYPFFSAAVANATALGCRHCLCRLLCFVCCRFSRCCLLPAAMAVVVTIACVAAGAILVPLVEALARWRATAAAQGGGHHTSPCCACQPPSCQSRIVLSPPLTPPTRAISHLSAPPPPTLTHFATKHVKWATSCECIIEQHRRHRREQVKY